MSNVIALNINTHRELRTKRKYYFRMKVKAREQNCYIFFSLFEDESFLKENSSAIIITQDPHQMY